MVENSKQTFGRTTPENVGRGSLRAFLPVLALVVASGCAHKPQQRMDFANTLTIPLDPQSQVHLTPDGQTAILNNEQILAHIKRSISPQSSAENADQRRYAENLSQSAAESITSRKLGVATFYTLNNKELRESVGHSRICTALRPHHNMDRDEILTRFTGVRYLSPRFERNIGQLRRNFGHHEDGHCYSYDTDLPVWSRESIADIYMAAKDYQETGNGDFANALPHLRNMSSIKHRGVSHYTTPALYAALPDLEALHNDKRLDNMTDAEILAFAQESVLTPEKDAPRKELQDQVNDRKTQLSISNGQVGFSYDGEPINITGKTRFSAADMSLINAYQSSLQAVYNTHERNLPLEERQDVMSQHYRETITDFQQSFNDPRLALAELRQKRFELGQEERVFTERFGKEASALKYTPLTIGTQQRAIEAAIIELDQAMQHEDGLEASTSHQKDSEHFPGT